MVGIHMLQPNDHASHIGHTGHYSDNVDVGWVKLIGHVGSSAGEESAAAQD